MALAVITAGVAVAEFASSMWDKYQQGKAKESIDYDTMISDEEKVYKEKVGMLDEELGLDIKQLTESRYAKSRALENQNMKLTDIFLGQTKKSGLAESGGLDYKLARGRETIVDENTSNITQFGIARDLAEHQRDTREASLYEDYLSTVNEYKLKKKEADAWYPGKNASYAFGVIGSLFGK